MSKKNKQKKVASPLLKNDTVPPPEKKTHATRSKKHWAILIILGTIFTLLAITLPLVVWSYDTYYSDKIYYGVHIAGLDVSGMSEEAAQATVEQKIQLIKNKGMMFTYTDHTTTLFPEFVPLDPDNAPLIAENIVDFDAQKIAQDAFLQGRTFEGPLSYPERLRIALAKPNIASSFTIHEEVLRDALKKEFGTFETPATNANLELNKETQTFMIQAQRAGKEFDYNALVKRLSAQLASLEVPQVFLELTEKQPTLTTEDVAPFLTQADAILSLAPITLRAENKTWTLERADLANLLEVHRDQANTPILGFSPTATAAYLEQKIIPTIAIEEQAPRFEMKDGRVTSFQTAKNGKTIDINKTIETLNEQIIINRATDITLAVKETISELQENPDALGISEIVASGESDFKGSPKNRIINIKVGASKINGLLIAPDTEFSLVKSLGEIDGKAGFLPELVIRDNKTTPEFGGGLCQLATTTFRSAIYAGLPITERKNHSYRVAYYEPAGFDAAIYDPKPDLKFKNDTGNYLLIQTRIEGTKIFVELWGKKDGRSVEVDKPTVYNIKPAGPTKLVESATLKPGEKKCTEKAHAGADASFQRRITFVNGEKKTDDFKSHYVIWPGICLVPKGSLSATTPTPSVDGVTPNADAATIPPGTTPAPTTTPEEAPPITIPATQTP